MRAPTVTNRDIALLQALGRLGSVVAASREVGMSRDRATYRLVRLQRAFGGPVVAGQRGGRAHGATQLTALGDRLVRQGFDAVELIDGRVGSSPASPPNWLRGRFRARPVPTLELARGLRLRVTFPADDGERVRAALDPEAILVARARFDSSARNVLLAVVERVRPRAAVPAQRLTVRAGPLRLHVAVTGEALEQLALGPGARVWLYVKATALRRVAPTTRGSRPS